MVEVVKGLILETSLGVDSADESPTSIGESDRDTLGLCDGYLPKKNEK